MMFWVDREKKYFLHWHVSANLINEVTIFWFLGHILSGSAAICTSIKNYESSYAESLCYMNNLDRHKHLSDATSKLKEIARASGNSNYYLPLHLAKTKRVTFNVHFLQFQYQLGYFSLAPFWLLPIQCLLYLQTCLTRRGLGGRGMGSLWPPPNKPGFVSRTSSCSISSSCSCSSSEFWSLHRPRLHFILLPGWWLYGDRSHLLRQTMKFLSLATKQRLI